MRIGAATSALVKSPQVGASQLRDDFKKELQAKLEGWIGKPGSERRAQIEKSIAPLLDQEGGFDLEKIGEEKSRELLKLQKASQDFEAIFVKGLLAQMRKSSFAEDSGPMADIAKDMMDQAVAESVSRSGGSIGIAKTIFVDMAQRIIKDNKVSTQGKSEQ